MIHSASLSFRTSSASSSASSSSASSSTFSARHSVPISTAVALLRSHTPTQPSPSRRQDIPFSKSAHCLINRLANSSSANRTLQLSSSSKRSSLISSSSTSFFTTSLLVRTHQGLNKERSLIRSLPDQIRPYVTGTLGEHTSEPMFLDELGRVPLLKLSSISVTSSPSSPLHTLSPENPNTLYIPHNNPRTHQCDSGKHSIKTDSGQHAKPGTTSDIAGVSASIQVKDGNLPRINELGQAWDWKDKDEMANPSIIPYPGNPHNPSSPLTPIPIASGFDTDVAPLRMTLSPYSLLTTDSHQLPASSTPSSAIKSTAVHTNQSNVQNDRTSSPTPRSRPKPTPIATGLHLQGSNPALTSVTVDYKREGVYHSETGPCIHPQVSWESGCPTSEERGAKAGGRDSGIALETWDAPCSRLDPTKSELQTNEARVKAKERFPTFDQLLQPDLALQDPFRMASNEPGQSAQRLERRQRCRSMVHPHSAPATETESSFIDPSDARPAATVPLGTGSKPRAKRIASMSFGSSAHIDANNSAMFSHELPPLPPMANSMTTTAPKTSFFVSPLLQDGATSSHQTYPQRRELGSSNSSQSSLSSSYSSSSSSASATISLSRAPSPTPNSISAFSHGISFSNMLDLATAKAENITGLYFAKQMNRRSVPLDFSSSPLGTFSSPHSSIPNSSETGTEHGMNQKTTGIRIDIDTPSPVSGIAHGLRAGDSTGVEGNSRKQDTFPPKSRRVRTFTAEPLQNNTHLDTSISPSADTQASVSSDRPSCTPIRGQHRRSHSASHFFHLSSLKRHSPAQFNLALCYEHGQGGVGKDLEKALNFYQQAADQGHTKASYNIGCICYNHGEVSKAMTWFERAGKCSVRGLVAEATYPSLSEHSKPQSSLDYPLPKQTTLPHELEDMLLGDMSGASGPFVAYLPAILCLALLCRQGVQLKDGAVILKQDYDQSVELLQSILQKASSQSHPGNERDVLETTYPCREPSSNRATDTEAESASASFAARKRGSQGGLNPSGHTLSSTLLSTSCPSLPLRNQSTSDSFVTSSDSTHSLSSQTVSDKTKRPSTVQDEADDEVLQDQVPARTRVQGSEGFEACNESLELHGYDDHESCSVTLAHQLLKVWKPVKAAKGEATPELAAEMEKRSKRILRHHLLYITNPILGRNLYNLGVLYDLHLGDAAIAIKCYRSAYHNSHGMIVPPASKDLSAQPGDSHQQQERQHSNLVTRINSAWNLGVLHVRCKEWKPAQEWFLRAQQDVHMLERQQHLSKEYSSAQASEAQDKNSVHGQKILGNDNDDNYQAPRTMRRSLVNVVPHTVTALPSDSPGKRHAREHGLLMHLGSIPNGSTAAECGSDGTHKQDSAYRRKKKRGTKGSEAILEETIRTDAGKVAWVLRWVESHIEP